MSAWVAINSKAATEFNRAGPWKCEKSIKSFFLSYLPSHLDAHRKKHCWIWGNDQLMVPVQVRGVLSFLPQGSTVTGHQSYLSCWEWAPTGTPNPTPHQHFPWAVGNLTVRSNPCLSMLAWVHLHWEAMSLSETDTSHHPPLLASFFWQLWLPPERQTIKDFFKSRNTECWFAACLCHQPASASGTFVQIVAADLPAPAFCPQETTGGHSQKWCLVLHLNVRSGTVSTTAGVKDNACLKLSLKQLLCRYLNKIGSSAACFFFSSWFSSSVEGERGATQRLWVTGWYND